MGAPVRSDSLIRLACVSAARTVPLPVPTGGEFDNLAVGTAHQLANDERPPASAS